MWVTDPLVKVFDHWHEYDTYEACTTTEWHGPPAVWDMANAGDRAHAAQRVPALNPGWMRQASNSRSPFSVERQCCVTGESRFP